MRNAILLGLLVLLSASCWAQDKVFDWVRASDEFAQLYTADYHAGRVYRPGNDGGKMHVNIQAKQPVTIAISFSREWNEEQEQPEFQWVLLLKEKYELTSVPKVYSLLTPERDRQQVSVRIKAPVPMTIALLPSQSADQIYDKPDTLGSALANTSCKQRGVQSLSFECTVNLADGRQSLVVVPDSTAKIPHKKAEIEMQAVECRANCDLLKK